MSPLLFIVFVVVGLLLVLLSGWHMTLYNIVRMAVWKIYILFKLGFYLCSGAGGILSLLGWRTRLKVVCTVVLAMLYCISPVDFIPDTIPIIGWLDDFAVTSFAASSIYGTLELFERYLAYQGRVRELENERNSMGDEIRSLGDRHICCVCQDSPISALILSCSHAATCHECAPLLHACPICRCDNTEWRRIYIS